MPLHMLWGDRDTWAGSPFMVPPCCCPRPNHLQSLAQHLLSQSGARTTHTVFLSPSPVGARTLDNQGAQVTLLWGPQLTQCWTRAALSAWLHGPHSAYMGVPSPWPHLAMGSPDDPLQGIPTPPSPLRCRVPQCTWSPGHHPPCLRGHAPPLQETPSHHPSALRSPSSSLWGP